MVSAADGLGLRMTEGCVGILCRHVFGIRLGMEFYFFGLVYMGFLRYGGSGSKSEGEGEGEGERKGDDEEKKTYLEPGVATPVIEVPHQEQGTRDSGDFAHEPDGIRRKPGLPHVNCHFSSNP